MATRADQRGWGPGWPNCSSSKLKTIRRPDGVVLPVREEIALLVAGLCDECERRGYDLHPGWCWGFACRAIRGTQKPSNHSWGLAVDLNAPTNPQSSRFVSDMPDWLPALWKSYGFGWGGDYRPPTKYDAMHMEYLGTPATAAVHTRRLYEGFLDDTNYPIPAPPVIIPEEEYDMLKIVQIIPERVGEWPQITPGAIFKTDGTPEGTYLVNTMPHANKLTEFKLAHEGVALVSPTWLWEVMTDYGRMPDMLKRYPFPGLVGSKPKDAQ